MQCVFIRLVRIITFFLIILISMSAYPKRNKCRWGKVPMVDGDPESAHAVTHTTVYHTKCKVVNDYHRSWWSNRKPRNLDLVEVMDLSSLERCMDVYRSRRSSSYVLMTPSGLMVPSLAVSSDDCWQCQNSHDLLGNILHDVLIFPLQCNSF